MFMSFLTWWYGKGLAWRTEKILEAYEMKLHMYSDYIVRSQIFDDIMEKYPDDSYLQEQIAVLSSIDNRD